jgi:hypothetical protein
VSRGVGQGLHLADLAAQAVRARHPTWEGPRLLQAVCAEMQRLVGPDRAFFLGARDAGRVLRVSRQTANAWLHELSAEGGPLGLVRRGTPGRTGPGSRASEWR